MAKSYDHRRAFTLIELLVVISIVSLLSSIVLASLNSARDKAQLAAAKQFASSIEHALADQAVVSWDFDECSGSTVQDSSGSGNNGTLAGATWVAGNTPSGIGCSVSINGLAASIRSADLSSRISLGPSQDFSFFVWVNSTDTSGTWQRRIMGFQGASGWNYLDFANGYPQVESRDNAATVWSVAAGPTFIGDGRWHHVGYVIDRAAGQASLYVDGRLMNSRTVSSSASFSSGYLCLGSQASASGCSGGFDFLGKEDGFRMYTKALTASEAGALYALEASRYGLAAR